MTVITPSILYDHIRCPHKVWRDVHGPQDEFVREENPFLQLLWERGIQHEADIISNFGFEYINCSQGTERERIDKTNAALSERAEYIYQGVLAHGDLFGIPDLLYWDGAEYLPIDIKSGSAEEVSDEDGSGGKPKKHYAVQLSLYCEILRRRGLHSSLKGIVIDTSGARVEYELASPQGPKTPETWFESFERTRAEAVALIKNEIQNDPALNSACKDCGWYGSCKEWAKETDDPTQLFYVGRSVRDTLRKDLDQASIKTICNLNVEELLARKKQDKTFLKGVGAASLEKIVTRAKLMTMKGEPIIHSPFTFPDVGTELFFDIESDPTQDLIYLHGFWIRDEDGERFVHFTAKEATDTAELEAWKNALDFIRSHDPDRTAIYYYSSYEKTSYRKLRKKFPDVISEEDLDAIFAYRNTIDLYSVVTKHTDWPLGSYGIKAIAQHLKFSWRDETPSGVLSIQWFNEFLKTGDEGLLNRVLEYNEDDCKATYVVKDYLKERMDEL